MNQTETLRLEDGRRVLRKTNHAAPSGFFTAEAAGLRALGVSGFRIPEVIHVTDGSITLEYIATGRPNAHSWEAAGRSLALLHQKTHSQFGFECDTYCGDSLQPNGRRTNGFDFYREQRYQPHIQRAREAGLLSQSEVSDLEKLIIRLEDWIPAQTPALLHGDLWTGNLLFDEHRHPVLIDPACYFGWPEADLAMTQAFGGFDARFYQAYRSAFPPEPGYEDRAALYNLYHWLNHLNLFGGMYHGQVSAVIRNYLG